MTDVTGRNFGDESPTMPTKSGSKAVKVVRHCGIEPNRRSLRLLKRIGDVQLFIRQGTFTLQYFVVTAMIFTEREDDGRKIEAIATRLW